MANEVINVLVPFDMVIDINFGLLKLIQFEYHNKDYFDFSFFNKSDDRIKFDMVTRYYKNPIDLLSCGVLSDEEEDDLYEEFLETKYTNILYLSWNTGIFDMIYNMSKMDGSYRYDILCNTEEEANLYKLRNGKCNNIVFKDDLKSIKDYKNIYINYIDDVLDYNIKNKILYISDCNYNKESIDDTLVFKAAPMMSLIGDNIINSIGLYPIDNKIFKLEDN